MNYEGSKEDAKLLVKTVLDVNLLAEDSWSLGF